MTTPDTSDRALALLDRASLMRVDPDPTVGIRVDKEMVAVGQRAVNPELYLSILGCLERAASTLGSLRWHLACTEPQGECSVPHDAFELIQAALVAAASCHWDQRDIDMIELLDEVLDSQALAVIHRLLADVHRRDASATCAPLGHPKP